MTVCILNVVALGVLPLLGSHTGCQGYSLQLEELSLDSLASPEECSRQPTPVWRLQSESFYFLKSSEKRLENPKGQEPSEK